MNRKFITALWEFVKTGADIENFKKLPVYQEMVNAYGEEEAERNIIVAFSVLRNWPIVLFKKLQAMGKIKGEIL